MTLLSVDTSDFLKLLTSNTDSGDEFVNVMIFSVSGYGIYTRNEYSWELYIRGQIIRRYTISQRVYKFII